MDLWIRSQDKRILQKVNNIFTNANYDDKRISSLTDDGETELGVYKTKERALEVLDEIQDLMIPVFEENEKFYDAPNCFANMEFMLYEMPEE